MTGTLTPYQIPEVIRFGRKKDDDNIEIKSIHLSPELKRELELYAEFTAEYHVHVVADTNRLTREDVENNRATIKKAVDAFKIAYMNAPEMLQVFIYNQFYGECDRNHEASYMEDRLLDALNGLSSVLKREKSPVSGLDEPLSNRERRVDFIRHVRRLLHDKLLQQGLSVDHIKWNENECKLVTEQDILSAYADGFLVNLIRELFYLHDHILDKYIAEVCQRFANTVDWDKCWNKYKDNIAAGKFLGEKDASDKTIERLIVDAQ